MDNRRYDLLLIDFDGTLCATRPAIVHCLTSTLAGATAAAPSAESIAASIARGIGLEETFQLLVPEAIQNDPDLLAALVGDYRARYEREGEQHTTIFPHWMETLDAIAARGAKVAVVSNKGIGAVQASLQRFGIDRFVALVVGDTPGVAKKPDPASFDHLVRGVFPAIARERTLVIGDTDADILFARNIGGHSCWARYGYGRPEICEALSPRYTIRSPEEIEAIVCS